MYAFKLSGENAAALAAFISNVFTFREFELQFVQMKSLFGVSTVSEMIAEVPSGETASTLPGVLVTFVTELPLKNIKPC